MITTIENGPVKFLSDDETPFDQLRESDCNCVGQPYCQPVNSGDTTPFQVNLSEATGTNLISNGTFESDTSWTKGSGWTIGLNRASHSSGGGTLSQTVSGVKALTYYKIVFTVSGYSNSETMQVSFTGDIVKTLNGNGTYTVYWFTDATLSSETIVFDPHSTTALNIDDVEIYEMSTVVYGIKDLNDSVVKTVSDGTGVTYYQDTASIEVDWSDVENGCYRLFLIDNGDNLFTDADDGTFESDASGWGLTEGDGITLSRVDGEVSDKTGDYKGKVEILGPELVANGDFSSANGWTLGTNWSIGSGVATHTPGSGTMFTSISIPSGATVRVTYDINNFVAGNHFIQVGIGDVITITGTGSFSHDVEVGSPNGLLFFSSNTTIEIDNVSVKQIGKIQDDLIFSGDTEITVEPNKDYEISGYVNLPTYLLALPSSNIINNNFIYLRPTSYAFSQCKSIQGATLDVQQFSIFTVLSLYSIKYENGNFVTRTRLNQAITVQDIWVRVSTIFNSGDNTSIKIGLYFNGTLSNYAIVDEIYVDSMEMRGPIDLQSECFTRGTFECTKLLSWSNNENAYGYTYEGTTFEHKLRVEGKLWQPKYAKDRKEVFVDSAGNRKILTSRTKKEEKLTTQHLPAYIHDALSIGLEHDNFYVDGEKYINEETEYSPLWRKSSLTAPVEIIVVKDSQDLTNSY